MIQAKVYSNFGFQFNHEFEDSVSIWIDTYSNLQYDDSKYKIFVALEPDVISWMYGGLINNYKRFNHVLSFDDRILKDIPNAKLFEYGTKWMSEDEYLNSNTDNKEYSTSFLCGRKNMTESHRMRHDVWRRQDEIITPKRFFSSSAQGPIDNRLCQILGSSKLDLFKSMYHICIENSKSNYYFSEKLIDCLLCKTIPIYYGLNKISDYFNIESILVVNNVDEIINVCNNLNEEFYNKNKENIIYNYEQSLKWINYDKRLYEKLIDIL